MVNPSLLLPNEFYSDFSLWSEHIVYKSRMFPPIVFNPILINTCVNFHKRLIGIKQKRDTKCMFQLQLINAYLSF